MAIISLETTLDTILGAARLAFLIPVLLILLTITVQVSLFLMRKAYWLMEGMLGNKLHREYQAKDNIRKPLGELSDSELVDSLKVGINLLLDRKEKSDMERDVERDARREVKRDMVKVVGRVERSRRRDSSFSLIEPSVDNVEK